jgi:hypothetical protein
MKKLVVLAIAVIGLVGCAVEDTSSLDNETEDTTSISTPTEESQISDEDTYVELIREKYFSVDNMSDYELIEFGQNMCSAIDDGLTVPGLAALAVEYEVDAEMLGFITGAATAAFCPRHSDFFDGY